MERRQRPRLAQQKVAVQHLNQRLELLEKQISRASDRSSQSTPISPTPQGTAREISPVPSPEASSTADEGQECKTPFPYNAFYFYYCNRDSENLVGREKC